MGTFTRRELFRRVARAAIVGPVVLATGEQQAELVYRLGSLLGKGSIIGRWLRGLWLPWW